MRTHDKENHKRCDKETAQKQYVTQEGVTREGVISAFHFSETRVFDLISLQTKVPTGCNRTYLAITFYSWLKYALHMVGLFVPQIALNKYTELKILLFLLPEAHQI